jgi:biopolymer transport protein ExbD
MFIVIAPLLELDRIELADGAVDPSDTSSSVQENSPITIYVRRDNSIWYGHQEVGDRQLTEMLREAKKNYPGVKPQVFHDREAHFGTYQKVKNAVEAAGFEQMDIILKPA